MEGPQHQGLELQARCPGTGQRSVPGEGGGLQDRGGWQAPAQGVPPHGRSPAVPLCLLPTFIDPPCAALIRLPMSFPGKDLVSHAKAPCCLASIWLWLSRGQCAQPHHRQPSRFVLVPARGQGWGQPGPSSWQERGQPVARSRCSRRQIDALNYLAREHEAAATATPCTGDMGPHSHLGMGPPHPVQMGWPGTHCRAAGTLHLPGGASGTPLGGGCRWHRAPHPPPAPLHALLAVPGCPQVVSLAPPALSPAGHPNPSPVASPCWQHGAGAAAAG